MSQAIFNNHQNAVAILLHKSQRSIDIAMCWFTNPLLFSILLKKAKAGVHIRLVIQFDQANFHPKGLPFFQLDRFGGLIKAYHQKELMHHKFAILDGEILLTGSYNWTGTQHVENVLVIEQSDLIQGYLSEFEKLWTNAKSLSDLANKKAKKPDFQKLFKPITWDIQDLRHAIILKGAKVWVSVFKEKEILIWNQCVQLQRHFLKVKTKFFSSNQEDWNADAFKEWIQKLNLSQMRILKNYCIRMETHDLILAVTSNGELLGVGMVGSTPIPSHLDAYPFARFVQWFEFLDDAKSIERLPCTPFGRFRGSGLQILSLFKDRKKSAA